jgi:integrase/recombinase XerD
LRSDLTLINEGFVAHLRSRHNADFTIALYRRFLGQVAGKLAKRGQSVSELGRRDVSGVLRMCLPGWESESCRPRRAGLHQWLKFINRFGDQEPPPFWQPWLDDYRRFMEADRGLAVCTCNTYTRIAGEYLAWQFRRRVLPLEDITPDEIRRFATFRCRGRKPKSANGDLSALRQFLRFAHLRGFCSPALALAVPAIPNYGRLTRPAILGEKDRHKFLASFDLASLEGRRDHAMALCMLDLGLRAIEVVRLSLGDIDLEQGTLAVPPAKAGRGRLLPIPLHVRASLRAYIRRRPATDHDRLFVGQVALIGRQLSSWAIASAMNRAYRRSGFPRWYGTHRLRHSFATRLYSHGANMKEIADLLGHRLVMTTDRYTQADSKALRSLAQPWPL